MFDTSWYLERNPDVAAAGSNALAHYLSDGAVEGRDPNPLFNTSWYLEQNPDVAAAGINPLAHYLSDGAVEGRDPNPLFDTSWYLEQNPDVAAAGINPLAHYLSSGAVEGRDPNPLFDTSWYLGQNPDVAAAGINPLAHYLSSGAVASCDPHPLFDTSWYLEQNPDVAAAGINPLAHYLSSGAAEGRDPNPLFDTSWYQEQNPDVALSSENPAVHYLLYGGPHGADPGPKFSTVHYLVANELNATEIGVPLVHYLTRGRVAGLRIAPVPVRPTGWDVPKGQPWRESFATRMSERLAAVARADLRPPFEDKSPTFSITTTVFDTDPDFIRDLAESVAGQAFGDFEWLILDNGSKSVETVAACATIAANDARVSLFRVEENIHIIGGNRYLLERAAGRYIVPVDSDDLLYADSLALLADALRRESAALPVLFYSDEQKIDAEGEPLELIWRRPFSFASALSTVPASHLLIFDRLHGLSAGVYTDDCARGCHDWDTAIRLTESGGRAVHVPEVLYGWRVHNASTASNDEVKAYIGDSQADVLRKSIERRKLQDRFRIEPHASGILGWYRAVRKADMLPPLEIEFVVPWDAEDLGSTEHNLRLLSGTLAARRVHYPARLHAEAMAIRRRLDDVPAVWTAFEDPSVLLEAINAAGTDIFAKAIVSSEARLFHADALIQAVGLLELDDRAGIVGGSLCLSGGMFLHGGLMTGLDHFVGALFHGWPTVSAPWTYTKVRQWVSAFPAVALCVRADVLRAGCRLSGLDRSDALHGTSFCLEVARLGYQSVLDGTMEGEVRDLLVAHIGAGEPVRVRLLNRFAEEASRLPVSPHLSRQGATFGALPEPDESKAHRQLHALHILPALNLRTAPHLVRHPTVNVLLPGARRASLSGGPNTALNIAYRLAALGFAVRILSTDVPPDPDLDPLWNHIVNISGGEVRFQHMTIVDASDRSRPVDIGANDIFFATAWWTARMAYAARSQTGCRPFVYLIQDFEPILYPASTLYAAAEETYNLPHFPIINTTLLRDYLVAEGIGLFHDAKHRAEALAFEPAIDRSYFYPEPKQFCADHRLVRGPGHARKKRRLLFYARPTTGIRNLFDLGVAALRSALSEHILSAENWELVGMGESFAPVDLGSGARLTCAPWLGFDAYAQQMRESDIILSLMLSPHPSYPPLEMAGCGGLAVTNTYGSRTAAKMAGISSNIIAAAPTVPAIVEALAEAVGRLDDFDARMEGASLSLPATWDESFADVIPALADFIRAQGVPNDATARPPLGEPLHLSLPTAEPGSAYANFLSAAAARRALVNHGMPEPGLFCFVTTVWNTAPAYLDVLARSLHRQIGGHEFEWLILDNGTTRPDTRAFLERLAKRRSYVRLERVEANLGIIRGMRFCLERARGRYILPLDSDDYLFPDCLRTLAWYVQKHGYPALLYTDEDKLVGERLSDPFQKPDWDPVLFSAQCFIAHLCAVDRKLALQLDVYGDPHTEGSHDWDTFTRFWTVGHVPLHVPHVLYSWRMHQQSTAGGNMGSKPVVFDSQRAVLERFLAASAAPERFDLVASPLFGETPDWWLRRRRTGSRPITTIVVRTKSDAGDVLDLRVADGLDHEATQIDFDAGLAGLHAKVADAGRRGRLVHLIAGGVVPDDDEWAWEAIGLFDRHADTVAVGGRIHADGTVLEAGRFLGFGDGCGCPDRGRLLSDPGYAAQMWKPRSVGAVSALHAVFDAAFLVDAIALAAGHGGSIAHLGAWVGGQARRAERRVIYSPFLSARTRVDFDALVEDTERSAFLSAFIDLMPDDALLPSGTGLDPETAYHPMLPAPVYRTPAATPLPPYGRWLEGHIARRSKTLATVASADRDGGSDAPFFSLLTTLYERTDADHFAVTAASVLAQTWGHFEWVVLAHGPTTPALDAVLERVSTDTRVRLHRLAHNLGIIGGMRHVLQQARGRYIVPLDGDDVLTTDALALVAGAIHDHCAPAFLYTDEDLVIGDQLSNPFLRAAWDPVLDLENSWIWHACAMRRSTALELGVYSDDGAEYCHDWDSLDRFTAAGHQPIHVPEVAYHWRHHAQSTSNTDSPNEASAASVRHVLQRKIDRLELSRRCSIAPYPIWRGAREWWITRDLEDLPPLVALTGSLAAVPPHFNFRLTVDFEQIEAWHKALDQMPTEGIVAVAGSGIAAANGETTTQEIAKLFEAFPEAVAITGPVSRDGIVQSAGFAVNAAGALTDFLRGRPTGDPGPYALAWKPFTIAAPASDWFFVRVSFLRTCLRTMPSHASPREIALWLGASAAAQDRRVVFTPLAAATASGTSFYDFEKRSTEMAWRSFMAAAAVVQPSRQGSAAYLPPRVG